MLDSLEFRIEMLLGKEIKIYFEDGSSCLADNPEDLIAAEPYAVRYEVVNTNHGDNVLRIAIIDADLVGRDRHRFPNLASEKISAYWKEQGANVELKLNYDNLDEYDQVFISKVFTDTPFPEDVFESEKIHLGGTGFFFDKAPNLPDEIEHHMPDYHLYDGWINREMARFEAECKKRGKEFCRSYYLGQFKEYLEYSIGFLTRGCFRQCPFCVNQKYERVFPHSPLEEFFDPTRSKICLLDDNFYGCGKWKEMQQELLDTKRSFKFKQGLDERLLTEEKCEKLFSGVYDGDYTFAFDNIADYELIRSKLQMIRRHTRSNNIRFYVLVGFESTDAIDIENAFKRIALLIRYRCLPYIMRYQGKDEVPWKESKYKTLYVSLARWCNQPSFFKKMSFRTFCERNQDFHRNPNTICSTLRAMRGFEEEHPEIAQKYFDLCYDQIDMDDVINGKEELDVIL